MPRPNDLDLQEIWDEGEMSGWDRGWAEKESFYERKIEKLNERLREFKENTATLLKDMVYFHIIGKKVNDIETIRMIRKYHPSVDVDYLNDIFEDE